jgi:coenzyme PQQ precursor peptide PqqA
MSGAPTASPRPAREVRTEASHPATPQRRWERPAFEVIPLDCEITAYAPAGDEPLF